MPGAPSPTFEQASGFVELSGEALLLHDHSSCKIGYHDEHLFMKELFIAQQINHLVLYLGFNNLSRG